MEPFKRDSPKSLKTIIEMRYSSSKNTWEYEIEDLEGVCWASERDLELENKTTDRRLKKGSKTTQSNHSFDEQIPRNVSLHTDSGGRITPLEPLLSTFADIGISKEANFHMLARSQFSVKERNTATTTSLCWAAGKVLKLVIPATSFNTSHTYCILAWDAST